MKSDFPESGATEQIDSLVSASDALKTRRSPRPLHARLPGIISVAYTIRQTSISAKLLSYIIRPSD